MKTVRGLRSFASINDAALVARQQRAVLEMMAAGVAPDDVLSHLVCALESANPGSRCSILVLDPDRGTLHHAAAPSLSDEYCSFVDGMSIGPSAGSCGTAAYTGETVIAADIGSDPRWADFRDVALRNGLRSCWSTPILSPEHDVLGTFAIYYHHPHAPGDDEIGRLGEFSHLAGIAIRHSQLYSRLAISEARFRSSFELNAAAMALTSTDGGLLTANDEFVALLALGDATVAGLQLLDFVHPDDVDSVRADLDAAAHRGVGRTDVACRLRPRHGGDVVAIGAVSPIRDGVGVVTSLCMSFIDVTARTRAIEDRIARSAAESARATAEAASRSKSDFLNAMSHELRVPLTSIVGYSELLESLDLSGERRAEAASGIALAASHLLTIVDDVLDVAKIEAGVADVVGEPVRLETVLDEVARLVAPLATKRGVAVHRSDAGDATVFADHRRLRQAILNVVSNAVKHGRHGGNVVIAVQAGRDGTTVSVRDDGTGIPPGIRARLFAPFVRSDTSSNDAEGSGLGLAVAHQLLALMDATIEVADAPDRGTIVTLSLPAVPARTATALSER